MERTDRFAWEQNLSRFSAQLYVETDPARMEVLRNLLIEEENRFGALSERLDKTDALIRDARFRIDRQEALVDGLDDDAPGFALAEAGLAAMRRTLELFEQYRAALARRLEGDGL